MSYILLIRKASEKERNKWFTSAFCFLMPTLISGAHSHPERCLFWCRNMLATLSRAICLSQPGAVPQPRDLSGGALGYLCQNKPTAEWAPERWKHGRGAERSGAASTGGCARTRGSQGMLNTAVLCVRQVFMQCLCAPLSRLRKRGHVAKIISQALKTTARPHPWGPRALHGCPPGTICSWTPCQVGAAPLFHCRNIYLILQHCFQDD